MREFGESLRWVMRNWPSGVAIATGKFDSKIHGMTVNSFNSVSLYPPMVTVTLANDTRTHELVVKSGYFGITILNDQQRDISERFAGKFAEQENRFVGLETFTLYSGSPFLQEGIGFVDCKVVHQYSMKASTLFVGEVLAAKHVEEHPQPLIYFNRGYYQLNHD